MAQQQSLWSQSVEIPARERLEKDLHVEAAVIGAGMAGVLIADRLKARGIETVVLEANRIGSGPNPQHHRQDYQPARCALRRADSQVWQGQGPSVRPGQ